MTTPGSSITLTPLRHEDNLELVSDLILRNGSLRQSFDSSITAIDKYSELSNPLQALGCVPIRFCPDERDLVKRGGGET
ncbi:hypothetical protein TNCV_3106631 [Trichonephila clavipes]|nr:hypothetical protein TNCV_3106631 [Trichonephila clavipes]